MKPSILDTNVVIDILERRHPTRNILNRIREKQISPVLCSTVFFELKKVRGLEKAEVMRRLNKKVGKKCIVIPAEPERLDMYAKRLVRRHANTHAGDSHILMLCRISNYMLITRDREMRLCAGKIGVKALHPKTV